MKPLRITARLITPLATSDDYSPSLDGLLEALWYDQRGEYSPNVTRETYQRAPLPLALGDLDGEWYWKVSAPHYRYRSPSSFQIRRRWDVADVGRVDFGKKSQKWNTSAGEFKSYDLPIFTRQIERITWYAVGDRNAVLELLAGCTALARKRAAGKGAIADRNGWTVEEVPEDWHLFGPRGQLMRLLPTRLAEAAGYVPEPEPRIVQFGWRPAARFNTEICYAPKESAIEDAKR